MYFLLLSLLPALFLATVSPWPDSLSLHNAGSLRADLAVSLVPSGCPSILGSSTAPSSHCPSSLGQDSSCLLSVSGLLGCWPLFDFIALLLPMYQPIPCGTIPLTYFQWFLFPGWTLASIAQKLCHFSSNCLFAPNPTALRGWGGQPTKLRFCFTSWLPAQLCQQRALGGDWKAGGGGNDRLLLV